MIVERFLHDKLERQRNPILLDTGPRSIKSSTILAQKSAGCTTERRFELKKKSNNTLEVEGYGVQINCWKLSKYYPSRHWRF